MATFASLCATRVAARKSAGLADQLRRHPVELVALPSLFFALLVASTLAATLLVSQASAVAEQKKLQSMADSAATSLSAAMQGALSPLLTVRSFLADMPDNARHSRAKAYFANAAPGLVAQFDAVACIQLAPYGHVSAIHPVATPLLNLTGVLTGGGLDLFQGIVPAGKPLYRPAALLALSTRGLVLQGPQTVFACVGSTCNVGVNSALAIIARLPIFVPSANASDMFADATWDGVPNTNQIGPFTSATNCSLNLSPSSGLSLCDTNAVGDGTRFWGFATIIFSWRRLLEVARISTLGDSDAGSVKWSVARKPDVFAGSLLDATSINANERVAGYNAQPLPTEAYANGVVSSVTVASSRWVVTLEPATGTFVPPWTIGAVIASVLVSALLTVMAFAHLRNQQLISDLLYSTLPTRVVQQIHAGSDASKSGIVFSERFEHVTILFTDIVHFTDLVSTISPSQTMEMLNSLFKDFDNIASRHGVVKVETIGDAYMAVAGTAAPHDPAAQAAQMAAVALDLLETAKSHRLPNGELLQIRIGIHCGPAVAGVVGITLPHWSLFGDAVNTASRMESSSVPGRCQVSDALAQLLLAGGAQAEGAGLVRRGEVSVKGKGTMFTWWLKRPAEDFPPLSAEDRALATTRSGGPLMLRQSSAGDVVSLGPLRGLGDAGASSGSATPGAQSPGGGYDGVVVEA